MEVEVKTRYSSKQAKAKILQEGNNIKVNFLEPQRAITPGQSAVFYVGDIVLGRRKDKSLILTSYENKSIINMQT